MAVQVLEPVLQRSEVRPSDRRQNLSLARFAWVAPLTVGLCLAANYLLKLVAQALDPSLSTMGQLQTPLVTLTVEGAVAAVIAFAVTALILPRPIFWYRVLGVAALIASLIPDVMLAMGGAATEAAMSVVGPLLNLVNLGSSASAGGPPAGAPPAAGAMPGTSIEHVVVLMLLHVVTAVVCIVMLTTFTRKPAPAITNA